MPAVRSDQEEFRRRHRDELLRLGVEVYPARTKRSQSIAEVLENWKLGSVVKIAGRVRSVRVQGRSSFMDVEDETAKIQTFMQADEMGGRYDELIARVDIGDFLDFSGVAFVTKRGERTINVSEATWLGKTLRPLPSAWHGVEDIELRYRHRELDLLMNAEQRGVFVARSKILKAVRSELEGRDFMEVETPMLQAIPGGANARPFVTHHQALNVDLYLRIAPELYLKRLMIGGLGRVYEIGRAFRNEGIDHDHNPEFTILECYAAYTDYNWMMGLTEDLVIAAAKAVRGRAELELDGRVVELQKPFPKMSYHDAIEKEAALDIDALDTPQLVKKCAELGLEIEANADRGRALETLFKSVVRPKLQAPVFIYDYPAELIPLAKKKQSDPRYVECVQLLVQGTELSKAFSELNDPEEQRQRFKDQEKLRALGDEEAQRIDEEYLRAMEYGMPPTGGLGIGVDRLVAVVTARHSLKEVLLFPTLRPERL